MVRYRSVESSLTQRSAVELARAIRSRATSAREVVEAHIEVLERTQSTVNAVAVQRFDAARREADAADRRVAATGLDDDLPPLLGVPCLIKELFDVEGLPHTAGLAGRRHVRATSTATAARRLLDAGLIALGLTNTAELALWFETENPVYGRTSNPFDPSRTAGGSSGGCAAAVACGGAPISLGTDTGGSIRVPAFWCGVFGHKPSAGLVPHTVAFPVLRGHTKRMVTFGPVTRRAEDLMPALRAIAGPDGIDEMATEAALGDPGTVSIKGLQVLLDEQPFAAGVGREIIDARDRAAAALEAAGARIEMVRIPDKRRMLGPGLAMLGDAGRASLAATFRDAGVRPLRARDALDPRAEITLPIRLWALADPAVAGVPKPVLRRLVERGHAFAHDLAELIGDGVLLHPPLPTVAPPHRRTYGRLLFFQAAGIFNVAGVPVTQVPTGLNRQGLPLGVQVVAGARRDHIAIAVALELERALGGWVAPRRL